MQEIFNNGAKNGFVIVDFNGRDIDPWYFVASDYPARGSWVANSVDATIYPTVVEARQIIDQLRGHYEIAQLVD